MDERRHGGAAREFRGLRSRPQGKKTQQRRYYPNPAQSESVIKMYRQQIDQLQAQLDSIDKQIANLRDAIAGKTVDSSRTYDPWGGWQGDWSSQIDQLQKSREGVLKQIDSVEEQIKKLNL
jgi:prefoldin subunit 5